MNTAYAELVRELDSPHVHRKPSHSFLTILRALEQADSPDERYARTIAKRTRIDPATVSRVLRRMVRLELADRWTEAGAAWQLGRPPRTYYHLTPAGLDLARKITSGVAR